ncbi:Maltose acetyltransferase [Onygenales sp. PD_40]|nr:Maltose acetyltransferase [Onygenales sp. PD_40]KAK2790877.1 Maltose acetyltransferase [Onygenales sp. PD_12]
MSAVASATVVNGSHDAGKDSNPEHSPSRFTAVNGRDQAAPPFSGAPDSHIPAPHDEERRNSIEHDHTARNSRTPSRQGEQLFETTNVPSQDPEASYVASDGQSSSANRNKRKRSESDDRQISPSSSYQDQSVSRSPMSKPERRVEQQIAPAPANGATHMPAGAEQDASTKVHRQPYSQLERNDSVQSTANGSTWDDYETHLANHPQLSQPIDSSDAQLAEALQRDVQEPDNGAKNWGAAHRPQSESADPNRKFANYTPERSQGAVQVGPKRKRVFSNRTKTGCMTCRRRKKKCDEQHPSCNNCLRGGFLCEGYSSRSTWQKPSTTKGPVPLQAKDGYSEMAPQYVHDMSPQRHERAPTAMHMDNGKSRPILLDEGDRAASQYITSPTGAGSRGSWSKGTWPSGPSSFTPEHPSKGEFRDGPGINNLSRAEQPKSDYHVALREMSHGAHPKPPMQVFQGNIEQRPNHQPHVDTSNYPAQARLALNNMEPQVAFDTKTEKEKMLAGEPYDYSDPQLVKDRERCKAALWRFSNAGNPIYGISAKERTRLLKEVLIPPPDAQTEAITPQPVGSLGPGVIVEAPLNCHYGYNINIGEDVLISENCNFADDCTINIGAHTWIGPNVTILSSMAIGSMQERKGSRSKYQGRPVVIAEDCWIGAGVTILPGVSLGRGAYIAPGEVVKSQILPYGFQGLKPNYP